MPELDLTRKPVPVPTEVSAPYWDGLKEHRVRLQRCDACGRLQFYPRSGCRHCGSSDLRWEEVTGEGHVYSYTIIHRAPFEAFADDVPYVYAIVELDAGPRLVSNIVTADPQTVRIGDRVTARFDDVDDGMTLLRFEPADDRG